MFIYYDRETDTEKVNTIFSPRELAEKLYFVTEGYWAEDGIEKEENIWNLASAFRKIEEEKNVLLYDFLETLLVYFFDTGIVKEEKESLWKQIAEKE